MEQVLGSGGWNTGVGVVVVVVVFIRQGLIIRGLEHEVLQQVLG